MSNVEEVINGIDFQTYTTDPRVQKTVAEKLERIWSEQSKFKVFFGKGETRGVRTIDIGAGEASYTPRIKMSLQGDGVRGNVEFEANPYKFDIFCQTVYPELVKCSKSGIKDHLNNDLKLCVNFLITCMQQKVDNCLCANLLNDLTNVVVADATNGVKEALANDSVLDYSKKCVKGDVLTLKALRRAIMMAKTGMVYNNPNKAGQTFILEPLKSSVEKVGNVEQVHNSYVFLLDSYQIEQLMNDPEWQDNQRYAGIRGEANNIFQGLVGIVDNCPVIDMGVYSIHQAGLMNSRTPDSVFQDHIDARNYADNTITLPSAYQKDESNPVSIGYLIGANALVMPSENTTKFWYDKRDGGRKISIGIDRFFAITKTKWRSFAGANQIYNNKDFGVIGIISSCE